MSCDNSADGFERSRYQPAPRKTLVVGLGNPILGDDGVGWQVAEAVSDSIAAGNGQLQAVDIECFALGGLSLMEHLVGYEKVIIIDSIQTRDGQQGQVYHLSLDDLPDFSTGHTTAAHDTSLQTAMQLGRTMGVDLPQEITLIGIEAKHVYDFSEELSPSVAAAVPEAVCAVLELLQIDPLPVSEQQVQDSVLIDDNLNRRMLVYQEE
jgi:hydrogenase maturation protease